MNKLSDMEQSNALNEIRILSAISHPNIVEYKESFFDEEDKTLCIVMEYLEGN